MGEFHHSPFGSVRRATYALCVALIGALVLALLGRLLGGLVGDSWDLFGCFVGAAATTWVMYGVEEHRHGPRLTTHLVIVFGTFSAISVAHALRQVREGRGIDFEPVGKFLWATIATSWWLLPAVALVLGVLRAADRRLLRSG